MLFAPAMLAKALVQKLLNSGGAMEFTMCKPGGRGARGRRGAQLGDPRWAPLWAASHPAAGASCPRGRGRTTAPPEHGAPVPATQQDLSAACVSRSLGVQAASQLRQNQHGVKCTT